MTRQNKIPKLRFQNANGEWHQSAFEEIAERSNSKFNPETSPTDFPCIELDCIEQNTGILLQTYSAKTLKSIKNKFKKGEVLFGKLRPYLRKFYLPKFDGVCSSEIWVLRGKKIENSFLFYLIQGAQFSDLMSITSGSKMPRAEWTSVSKIKFYYPSLPEQQKIASFLTAVDDKIQQLTRKKELLEQYKKGVMQQIFSQQIRFKPDEGGEFPEWEKKKVQDFAPLQRGFDLPVSLIKEGKYPVVFSNGILKYHSEFKVKGPGVVTGRSGTIGKVSYVKDDFWPHNTSLWVTTMNGNLPLYVYYFYIQFDLTRFATGSGVPTLNRNDIHSQIIQVPILEEQQKIASFLSALDEKINLVTTQLNQTRLWKKGLLQQMFV